MTDLERFKEFLDGMGIPHVCGSMTPPSRGWNPDDARIYDGYRRSYHAQASDEISIREMNDKRRVWSVSIAKGHLLFGEDGKFKGVLSDETGEYEPNTKGDGYWSMPPLDAKHLERPI